MEPQIPAQTPNCEDEIDLYQLLLVLVRRRKIIITVCLLFTLLSGAAIFLMTPKYEITAIIKPGITGFDDKGNPVSDLKPSDLKTWISSGAYNSSLYQEFGDNTPKVMASAAVKSGLVKIYTYYPDPKEGIKIVDKVISLMKGGVEGGLLMRVSAERKRIESNISSLMKKLQDLEVKKKNISDKIKSTEMAIEVVKGSIEDKKLQIENIRSSISKLEHDKRLLREDIETLTRTINELSKKIAFIDKNTEDLIKERMCMIKSGPQNKLSLLIFSNIIQDNLVYASNLSLRISGIMEKIVSKKAQLRDKDLRIEHLKNQIKSIQISVDTNLKKKIADLRASLEELKLQRDQILPKSEQAVKAKIEELRERMKLLTAVEVVQYPFSSLKPVKPRKMITVAVGFMLGLFLGIFLAFFTEYISSSKRRREEVDNGS